VREWLDEARSFRKSLPELIREYVELHQQAEAGMILAERVLEKKTELEEQLQALTEPTRAYLNQLPGFPVIFSISVTISRPPDAETAIAVKNLDRIVWENPLPRPRQQNQTRVQVLEYFPLGEEDRRATLRCEYTLHAFNKLQERETERQRESLIAGLVLVAATLIAGVFVFRFLAREVRRETAQLQATAEAEHRERELLETRLRRREAERAREELDRKLLERQLETAELESRAAEAERATLQMKSQLYASIGIMAGSYAHNIKNLLVRPNDLLNRCLDAEGIAPEHHAMLQEVRGTLGTVTERLQLILRTVRRDPTNAELTLIDLRQLILDTVHTWQEIGWEKWKLRLVANELPTSPVQIRGDLSHLQQAIENLLFNARDATFEMRNHLREVARAETMLDPSTRKQRLIEAASWKGEIRFRLLRDSSGVILEVQDNGIGMTADVRANCLKTHFTTKRDNALYEGYTAGMGLGLSFVAMVLDHHHSELQIESEPQHGATFRIRFVEEQA
jgi:signal transduction histidine kinase